MHTIEFKAKIENGIVYIPKDIQELQKNVKARFIVIIDNNQSESDTPSIKKLSSIAIKTKDFKFNRSEANER